MIRRLAYWALVPFIIPQGLLLRRNAPRFPMAAGPREGSVGNARGPELNLLAIGDSIIAGVGAPTVEQALPGQVAIALARDLDVPVHWQALGKIGLDARQVLDRLLPQLTAREFAVIVVSVGVNDVTSLKRSARWRQDLCDLLDALRRNSPRAVIALVGVPPLGHFPLLRPPLRTAFGLRAKIFDKVAESVIAERTGMIHLPLEFDPRPEKFSADGYHPSPEGYRELGEALAAVVATRMRSARPDKASPG